MHALGHDKSNLEISLKNVNMVIFGRTQCVSIKGVLSELRELAYGVPQGSVLGPIEFFIYTTPLGAILMDYKFNYHIYIYKHVYVMNLSLKLEKGW